MLRLFWRGPALDGEGPVAADTGRCAALASGVTAAVLEVSGAAFLASSALRFAFS